MKKIFASAILIGVASGAAFAAAPSAPVVTSAPNWYNVELIVFRSTDPAAGNGETWPADPGLPDWDSAVALSAPDSIGPPVPYQALSPVGEQLDDAWNRLKRAHAYEPLIHMTWTQPIADRASAPAVRVGVPPTAAPAAATIETTAAATVSGAAVLAPATVPTPVYGNVKLSTTGPYLHFDLDLILQGPPAKVPTTGTAINTAVLAPPAGTGAQPALPAMQLYRLREDMRVNGGKLAYFDNPLFGAIVLVTPVRH